MGCHFLLQGIIPNQGSFALQADSLRSELPEKPDVMVEIAFKHVNFFNISYM